MQTQPIRNPKGGGRKPGSLSKNTIKKMAIKLIEQAVTDDGLPIELRTQAALKLIEVSHG